MSFREKHLWISIIGAVGVWGFYFWSVGTRVARGELRADDFAGDIGGLFFLCLVGVVVLEIVLTLIATATTSKVDKTSRDEREIGAALKGSHVALMTLTALIMVLALLVYLGGLVGGNLVEGRAGYTTDVNAMVLLANVLVACLVLAETIRAGVTLALLKGLR
ncbi:hypothetical protein [Brevundimonas variabilis]|uniref:Uncharacterized protein n=1 Tax=Brevundimonas variabilis TaxID=74312 RepID=A0A7W9CFE6_9CAUL|nr:hypothetical protein [Brevundimonas variabilis]MBB5744654.1 hypothetical protein [Brevundimonas variabilis]